MAWEPSIILIKRKKRKGEIAALDFSQNRHFLMFLNIICPCLAATMSTFRESWTRRDRWCWGGESKGGSDRYSCPRTRGDDSDQFTPLLSSSLFSILTSRLWQLTWRHESDDDILWPLPCLTHYFDTSCLDGMSVLMLTNLERSPLFSVVLCAKSVFKLFRQGGKKKEAFTLLCILEWKDKRESGINDTTYYQALFSVVA